MARMDGPAQLDVEASPLTRALASCKPLYAVPRDDIIGSVLRPGMRASAAVDCMVGYFDSQSLGLVAPGLADFINHSNGILRLIVSPQLPQGDIDALRRAANQDQRNALLQEAFDRLLDNAHGLQSDSVARHAQLCLGYLVSIGRLQLQVAVMRRGIFHPKIWLFKDGQTTVAVHGSSNATRPGLMYNYENVNVSRPWRGDDAAITVRAYEQQFMRLWDHEDADAVVVPSNVALQAKIFQTPDGRPPQEGDFERAVAALHQTELGMGKSVLRVPSNLDLDSGAFAHQGRAISAWRAAGYRGVLAMATGSGKTITALAALAGLDYSRRKLIIVSAPFLPLVDQWSEGVRDFGVEPLALSGTQEAKLRRLYLALRALSLGAEIVQVCVVTNDFLVSPGMRELLREAPSSVDVVLVADEMHNLGRRAFLEDPPTRADMRLGLSATPRRQYDDEGTEALFEYFGPVCFEYSLAEAIGTCLVPYDYHIHSVQLADDEFDEYERLTQRLVQLGHSQDATAAVSEEARVVLIKRRAVVEGAREKLTVLAQLLAERSSQAGGALIYATDKMPDQLRAVNRILRDAGYRYHQLTYEETGGRRGAKQILRDFAAGKYEFLTAKRVLDEGVDVPEVVEAFLLASNTVERQWIQRRGRILRRCDSIGKQSADLHDFVVLPSDRNSSAGKALLRGELRRCQEFAALSSNAGRAGGPYEYLEGL